MPLREYKCQVCARGEERIESWDQAPPARCPYCRATAYHRVLSAPQVLVRGSPHVDGERRFVRPRVVRNPDGSETAYTSLHQARTAEYERAGRVTSNGLARTLLAKANARKLASGMLPGRASTAYREAAEGAPR